MTKLSTANSLSHLRAKTVRHPTCLNPSQTPLRHPLTCGNTTPSDCLTHPPNETPDSPCNSREKRCLKVSPLTGRAGNPTPAPAHPEKRGHPTTTKEDPMKHTISHYHQDHPEAQLERIELHR